MTHNPCDTQAALAARTSIAQAKAGLLLWAQERDAQSVRARPKRAMIVAFGVAVALGGLVLTRALTSRAGSKSAEKGRASMDKRLIGLLLAAKAGSWLIPHAAAAVRATHKPAGTVS